MDFVIIFRGTEGDPKSRLAPYKERVTAREVVGEEKYERQSRIKLLVKLKKHGNGHDKACNVLLRSQIPI